MSMFSEEDVLHVVDKSEFEHKPEALAPDNKIPSVQSADIIKFNPGGVIRMLPEPLLFEPKTFNDMAEQFLKYIWQKRKTLGSDTVKVHI